MYNPYLPKLARVKKIKPETSDTKLFTFEFVNKSDRKNFNFIYGQFLMAGVFGFSEAAFDICSSAAKLDTFDLAIRKVGALTEKFHQLKIGETVTIRGPFGNGLPQDKLKNKDLLLIAGGCGLAAMRSLILDYLAKKIEINRLSVFYGCLNEKSLLFKDEYFGWRKKVELDVILENPSGKWTGLKGLIPSLFNDREDFRDTAALIVGPPIMYQPIIKELLKRKVSAADIFVSLERRMYCGLGVCQHCALGPYYVCKDGPIFCWEQIKDIPNVI